MPPTVSIIRCADYDDQRVYLAVKEAVGLLGGMGQFAKKGERILVKPNLLSPRPPSSAVTTHPSIVKAVLTLLKEAGATPFVGDSTGVGTARKNAGPAGITAICREQGVEFVELKTPVIAENPSGLVFKRLEVSKEALDADGIISLAKLKTHAQMLLTLGVKNIFGCVPGRLKPQWHLAAGTDTKAFAGMILDLYLFLRPRLTIIDAIVAMDGNGPAAGDPKPLGLVFASSDAIRMDMAASEVVGARPSSVPILKEAIRRGLVKEGSSDTVIRGADIPDVKTTGFRFPREMDIDFSSRLPYFAAKRLKKALTARPHIEHRRCTLCGTCVAVCPPAIMNKKTRIEIDYETCIRCFCCQEACPHSAISVKEGWLRRLLVSKI